MSILNNKLINDQDALTAYFDYSLGLRQFKAEMGINDVKLASTIFDQSYTFFMDNLKEAELSKYNYYIFDADEMIAIVNLAKDRYRNKKIDPYSGVVYEGANSKFMIDKLYRLYFEATYGEKLIEHSFAAMRMAAQEMGILYDDDAQLVDALNNLGITEYRQYIILRTGFLKEIEPELFFDGLARYSDFLKGILVNPENYLVEGALSIESDLLKKRMAIDELAKKDYENESWREFYFEQLDRSLRTRLKVRGIDFDIPKDDMIDMRLAPYYWRHNARVILEDIDAPFWDWPLKDVDSFDIGDLVQGIVVSVLAVAVGGAIFNFTKGLFASSSATTTATGAANAVSSTTTAVGNAGTVTEATVMMETAAGTGSMVPVTEVATSIAQPAAFTPKGMVWVGSDVVVPATATTPAYALSPPNFLGYSKLAVVGQPVVNVKAGGSYAAYLMGGGKPSILKDFAFTARDKLMKAAINGVASYAISKPIQSALAKDKEELMEKQAILEEGILAERQRLAAIELERQKLSEKDYDVKQLVITGVLIVAAATLT